MNKGKVIKNSKGITLVALVVTVIIILILAGLIVATVTNENILDKMTSGADAFEISEDIDIISEIRKEILVKNAGDVPLEPFGDLLTERHFDAYEGVEEYNGRKIKADELLVGCPHGDHTYLVNGDGTENLGGTLKDIPVITISEQEINQNWTTEQSGETDVNFTVTITCENGLKSITLPKGKEVSNLNETTIKNSDSNIKNITIQKEAGKITKIEIKYNVTQSGSYTFKAKSRNDVIAKKTTDVDKIVLGRNNIQIDYEPKKDTNEDVKVTISSTNTSDRYWIEYCVKYTDGTLKEDWKTGTKFTTDINCKVYARLTDSRGNKGSEKEENINNIDTLVPSVTNIAVASKTINSFTIQATAKDKNATRDYGMSGIGAFKVYVNGEYYKTVPTNSRTQESTLNCEVTDRKVGTTYSYYVIAVDNAGNESSKSETKTETTLHQYNITYNGNGSTGGSTASQIKTEGTAIKLQNSGFTKTGYTFKEWNTKADGTGTSYAAGADYTNNSELTLYAQWTANIYTVTFNANGGTCGTANKQVTYDANYGDLPTATRTGYTFTGWFTQASGGTQVISTTKVTTASNHTLYAQWTANTYAVTFNANGGTCGTANKQVTYDATYGDLPTATRTGYTFAGWFTQASGGTQVTSTTKVTTASNHTLYAHWTANTYTVTYNGNGATGGSTAQSTHTYDVAKALTANGFTRAYTVTYNHNYSGSTNTAKTSTYTFKNWNTKADGTGTTYTNQQSVKNLGTSGNVNLYAQWNTGNTVSYAPTRTGYTFGGWYKEAACTNKVSDANYTPTANITVYAKWTANKYTLTVKHYLENIDDKKYQLRETTTFPNIDYGTSITLANYKKTITNGTYSYGSLTESTEGGTATATTTMGINTTICLYYSRNQYTLTVNKKDHIIASVTGGGTYKVGKKVTIGATISTGAPTGYSYSWDRWTSSNTSLIADGGQQNRTITMPAGNITLTANGKQNVNSYTVTYYIDGVKNETTVKSGTVFNKTASKYGYEFEGWNTSEITESTTTKPDNCATSFTINSNIELWAVFSNITEVPNDNGYTKTGWTYTPYTDGRLEIAYKYYAYDYMTKDLIGSVDASRLSDASFNKPESSVKVYAGGSYTVEQEVDVGSGYIDVGNSGGVQYQYIVAHLWYVQFYEYVKVYRTSI